MRWIPTTVIVIVIFSGGILVGHYYTKDARIPVQELIQKMEVSENGVPYKFINPLLFCNDQNITNGDANTMEDMVGTYINQEKKKGDIIDASFYFRDLNGGPWALVNPDFTTIPASLLKVPLALSIYQHAEKNPAFLSTKIEFKGGANTDQSEHFQPTERIQPNTIYTVSDLVRFMLKDSDNSAMYLLGSMLDPEELQDSYTRLGIRPPTTQSGYTINVRTYASFFRVLYNATYLTQDNSEQLLSTLSNSTFTQGIVAGLPQGTPVSHKFGESNPGDGTVRLNDCGIVYKPNQPYLLCVLTEGTNFDTLATVISAISKKVYGTLQNQN